MPISLLANFAPFCGLVKTKKGEIMKLINGAEYIESLRELNPKIYYIRVKESMTSLVTLPLPRMCVRPQ